MGLGLLLLVVAMMTPGCGVTPDPVDSPEEVVRAFLGSLDEHDVEIRELTSSGDTVRVLLVDRNRFTELLELEPWIVEATFVVREGLIVEEAAREVAVDRPPLTRRFERALEPVRRWAVEARPAEAKAVFGDGGVARYDGPTARRLLALIEAHHRTSGEDR